MFNPWLALTCDAVRLGLEAQAVIALRLGRLAKGGAAGWTEAQRMTTEKITTLANAQVAAAMMMLSGKHSAPVARKTIAIYGKRVRANRRRLSR